MKVRIVLADPHLRVVYRRRRGGGKPPADMLKKPVKPGTMRQDILDYFSCNPRGGSISGAAASFNISRANVMSHWTALHRDHGFGYRIDGDVLVPLEPGA